MLIRIIDSSDFEQLRTLAEIAVAEGYQFLTRLISDLETGATFLDRPDEFFLGAVVNVEIVAIAGITHDPYSPEPGLGRIRHVYVRPDHRGQGIGTALVREVETRAAEFYSRFVLRTDTEAGARFYEAIGYRPVHFESATHTRP
jgi:ribosomal protein S18 acetylase RimI-like enzyme